MIFHYTLCDEIGRVWFLLSEEAQFVAQQVPFCDVAQQVPRSQSYLLSLSCNQILIHQCLERQWVEQAE